MSDTTTTVTLPKVGTYTIDPAHTEVGFVARHLVGTKVRGRCPARGAPSPAPGHRPLPESSPFPWSPASVSPKISPIPILSD